MIDNDQANSELGRASRRLAFVMQGYRVDYQQVDRMQDALFQYGDAITSRLHELIEEVKQNHAEGTRITQE